MFLCGNRSQHSWICCQWGWGPTPTLTSESTSAFLPSIPLHACLCRPQPRCQRMVSLGGCCWHVVLGQTHGVSSSDMLGCPCLLQSRSHPCPWSSANPVAAPTCNEFPSLGTARELWLLGSGCPGRGWGTGRRRRKGFDGRVLCTEGTLGGPAQSKASQKGLWLEQEGFHCYSEACVNPNIVSNCGSRNWGTAGSLTWRAKGHWEPEEAALLVIWCCHLTERWHILKNSAGSLSASSNWPPQCSCAYWPG